MRKGLLVFLITLLLFFTTGAAVEGVKAEDLIALEALVDTMGGKIGDFREQITAFQGQIGAFITRINEMEQKALALGQADQFLWAKVENADEVLREKILSDEAEQEASFQEKVWAINQRLKWVDSGISGLKEEIGNVYNEIYKLNGKEEEYKQVYTAVDEITKTVTLLKEQDTVLMDLMTNRDDALSKSLETSESHMKEAIILLEDSCRDLQNMLNGVKLTSVENKSWLSLVDAAVLELKETLTQLKDQDVILVELVKTSDEALKNEMLQTIKGESESYYQLLQAQLSNLLRKAGNLETQDASTAALIEKIVAEIAMMKEKMNAYSLMEKQVWEKLSEQEENLKSWVSTTIDNNVNQKYLVINDQINLINGIIGSLKSDDANTQIELSGLRENISLLRETLRVLQEEDKVLAESLGEQESNVKNWIKENVQQSIQEKIDLIGEQLLSIVRTLKELETDDVDTEKAINEVTDNVSEIESSILSLQSDDVFLWNKIYATEKSLDEKINQGNVELNNLIVNKVVALNQRLKWIDSGIERIKSDIKTMNDDIGTLDEAVTKVEVEANEFRITIAQKIDDRVWAINKRITWSEKGLAKLKQGLEEQSKTMESAQVQLKEELDNRIWGVNKRLSWLESSVAELKKVETENEKLTAVSISNLELEIQLLKARTQTVELEKALQNTLSDMIISRINQIQERCTQIENQISSVQKDYATKAEVLQVEQKVDDKFAANDVRVKWVEQTLSSQKKQLDNLKSEIVEVDERLSGELTNRVWAINQRLKWIDNAVSGLKTDKTDVAVFDAAVEDIQKQLLELGEDILGLAVAIQKNNDGIKKANALIEQTSETLGGKIETTEKDIQSQMASMKARLEASISSNGKIIDSHSRTLSDLETRIKALEDSVFEKPKNTEPFAIFLILAGVVGVGILLANQ
jgi:chromosome segregation ATPase